MTDILRFGCRFFSALAKYVDEGSQLFHGNELNHGNREARAFSFRNNSVPWKSEYSRSFTHTPKRNSLPNGLLLTLRQLITSVQLFTLRILQRDDSFSRNHGCYCRFNFSMKFGFNMFGIDLNDERVAH